jgi:hypothetical protein
MKTAILGWGSLLNNLGNIPVVGNWQSGGPELPLEFSRISQDGRLTLVVDEQHGQANQVFYVQSGRDTIREAIEDLNEREGSGDVSKICWVSLVSENTCETATAKYPDAVAGVKNWAAEKGFDAVIWCGFRPRFRDAGQPNSFSPENALVYINGLRGETKNAATAYINAVHPRIRTPFRDLFAPAPASENPVLETPAQSLAPVAVPVAETPIRNTIIGNSANGTSNLSDIVVANLKNALLNKFIRREVKIVDVLPTSEIVLEDGVIINLSSARSYEVVG